MTSNQIPSSGLVRRSSIQSQFVALEKERDNFRKEMEGAERERRSIEKALQELKGNQQALVHEKQRVKAELGEASKKRCSLEHEKSRLGRILENENRALKDCAAHYHSLKKAGSSRKEDFVKKLDSVNDSFSSLLHRKGAIQCQHFVSMEAILAMYPMAKGESAGSSPISNKLETAQANFIEQKTTYKQLGEHLASVKLAAHTSHPSATDWEAKEERWIGGRDKSVSAQVLGDQGQQQMELFYGSQPHDVSQDSMVRV